MAMNEGKWRELLKISLNCRLKFIEHDSMRCFISIDETFKSDSIPHRATIYQRVNKFCCGETKNFKAEILEVDRCRELWKSQKWVKIVSANGCWWWCGAAWSSRSSQFVTHTANDLSSSARLLLTRTEHKKPLPAGSFQQDKSFLSSRRCWAFI